jgi:hypothetical protein
MSQIKYPKAQAQVWLGMSQFGLVLAFLATRPEPIGLVFSNPQDSMKTLKLPGI